MTKNNTIKVAKHCALALLDVIKGDSEKAGLRLEMLGKHIRPAPLVPPVKPKKVVSLEEIKERLTNLSKDPEWIKLKLKNHSAQ